MRPLDVLSDWQRERRIAALRLELARTEPVEARRELFTRLEREVIARDVRRAKIRESSL